MNMPYPSGKGDCEVPCDRNKCSSGEKRSSSHAGVVSMTTLTLTNWRASKLTFKTINTFINEDLKKRGKLTGTFTRGLGEAQPDLLEEVRERGFELEPQRKQSLEHKKKQQKATKEGRRDSSPTTWCSVGASKHQDGMLKTTGDTNVVGDLVLQVLP